MDLVNKVLAQRYEIIEEIGKGGMALVYKARDNMLNRYVAIKVLKEEYKDDKEFVRRFNVEAQAAARISNPHVVSIYDVGYEDGYYYIVMEHIKGITLKKHIAEKGKLHWHDAAGYAAQICEGLAAAHKNNVIHRDIKPQNIIITPEGELKVTDFGIARASNSQATVTVANTTIGTVHYLSPEQARGGYTDERTDIYSLGVVLYEMLTGRLPFVDDSPVAVAIKHIQETPTPLREIDPSIPEGIEQITLRAMKKEQNDRYSSAEEFLNDLNEILIDPTYIIEGSRKIADIDDESSSTKKLQRVGEEDLENYWKERRKQEKKDKGRPNMDEEESKLRDYENKRTGRDARKKERRVTILAVIAAVLVVAALGTVFVGLTGGFNFFGTTDSIEIPKLIDMDIEKARNQYKDNFSIVLRSEKPDSKKAGTILEQTPEKGKKVTKRDDIVIYVVVSAGKDFAKMENYADWKVEDAEKALKDAGYQVNIIEQISDSHEKGIVIGQDPAPEVSIANGGYVKLYVSKGSEDEQEKDNQDENQDNKDNQTDNNDDQNSGQNNGTTSSNEGNNSNTGTTGQTGTVTPGIGD